MNLYTVLSRWLDNIARPELNALNRSWPAFKVCGYAGLALAILLTITLTVLLGLSPWVMSGVIGISILTFLGLAMITKIITGEEQLIYYHHEIAIIVVAAVLLKMLSQPVLPYLDVLILGIGMFLVCGRVGCLMVGCCHGRPNDLGVCYRKEHAAAGFTHYFVGVRLFPIQAVESLWVLGVVIAGVIFRLNGSLPGEVLAWYVITYDIGRFCFEFVRGDPDRPYYLGFSEGQWTSIILMCAVVGGEISGTFTFHLWHVGATAGMALTMIFVALCGRFRGKLKHQILLPRHIKEIAEAVEMISNTDTPNKVVAHDDAAQISIPMSCTSLGIQISADKIHNYKTSVDHYTLSSKKETLSKEIAETLADLIVKLKNQSGSKELIIRNRGVFHLLINPLTAGRQA